MDRRERIEDLEVALQIAFTGWQTGLWTSFPGIVQSFDPVKKTVVIQPAIQARLVSPKTAEVTWTTLPKLLDCPVYFPSGGGCTLTFPIAQGDECLVVFSSRCIDAWWKAGGVQKQAILRMHDLSDGFAFVGISSVPHVPSNIDTSQVQLRSNDGAAAISINPTTHAVSLVTSGPLSIQASSVTINGKTVAIGGTLTNNGVDVGSAHTHPGVQVGGASTGTPQ